jgi:predicted ArsR family transcriptional regulator
VRPTRPLADTGAMSTGTAWYSAISSSSRVELLALLAERPGSAIAELTAATGLHPNTVREHLQRLEDDGHVVRSTERRTTRGRPRVLYSAVLGGRASSPIGRRKAKDAAARGDLIRRVMPAAAPDAGSLAPDAVHQLDAIVDHLVESGFDPAFDGDALRLDVAPCPHRFAQADHRERLCAVHLGIMQAVLADAGGPLRAESVSTAGLPDGCIVQLALAAVAADR